MHQYFEDVRLNPNYVHWIQCHTIAIILILRTLGFRCNLSYANRQ